MAGRDEPTGRGRVFLELQAVVDFFEHRAQPSLVVDGPDMRLVAANATVRHLLSEEDVLGQPLFAAAKELAEQGYFELYEQVYATGQETSGREWQLHLLRPDGTKQVVWLDHSIRPRWGPDGALVGAFSDGEDVTEQVLARQALESELASVTEQFAQAREVIDTFQRALLPDRVPVLPTLDVAAHYLLAADEQAAGGDWYDVATSTDGHVTLVVGDVVGHGVAASAAMGQLRAVLLDHLAIEPTIAEAVAAVDRWAAADAHAFAATVCVVDLDPGTGDLAYVTAGHPPPLVLDRDGEESDHGRYLAPTGAGPLGRAGGIVAGRGRLAEGEIVVLYTDGIVELPGRSPLECTVELARDARRAVRNTLLPIDAPDLAVERIAHHIIATMVRQAGHRDDITVLAAQRRSPRSPLQLRLVSGVGAALVAREALATWLGALDLHPDDVDVLRHAVTELVDNVTDHAYGDHVGPVHVTVGLEDDATLELVVRDEGRWRERSEPAVEEAEGRGLGLAVVGDLVDHIDLDHSPPGTGTTVSVRHRARRRAGILDDVTVPVAVASTATAEESVFDLWQEEATLGARGVLDARTVPQLRSLLAVVVAPGHPPRSRSI